MSGFPRIFAEGLAAQLKANIALLAAVHAEWPEKSVVMTLPSVTVTTSPNPQYERCSPYLVSQGRVVGTQAQTVYCVGQWELSAQLDIWTKHKRQRDAVFDAVWKFLEPPTQGRGFCFQLQDYYGEYVSIWQTGFRFVDVEDSVTRKEWRAQVNIGASCRAVNNTSEYIITQPPVLTFTTPDVIT